MIINKNVKSDAMNKFWRNVSVFTVSILGLIIVTGLIILLVKPVWSLENKVPLKIEIQQISTTKSYCLLDHPLYDILRVYSYADNTILHYNSSEKNNNKVIEQTKVTVVDNPLTKTEDNVWFCLRDTNYNCLLASAFDEEDNAAVKLYPVHENIWVDNSQNTYSTFYDSIKICYRIYQEPEKPFLIRTEDDTTVLLFHKVKLKELFPIWPMYVDDSPAYQEVADSLSSFLGRKFTNRDIYRLITDRMRHEWLANSLDNIRGGKFFTGKIMAITDLDNDGREDFLILVAGDRFVPGYLICYDLQNRVIKWELPFYLTLWDLFLQDLDNDGIQEIILTFYTSGVGCSSDWFEHELRLDPTKSCIVALDNEGHLKKFEGREAIFETGGVFSSAVTCPLPSGKILAAPTSGYDESEKHVLSIDFMNDQVDILDVSYIEAWLLEAEDEEINLYARNDTQVFKTTLDAELAVKNVFNLKFDNTIQPIAGNEFNFEGRKYQLFSPLTIVDNKLQAVFSDLDYTPKEMQQRDNDVYFTQKIGNEQGSKLMKMSISENNTRNSLYIELWIFTILLLLVYIITRAFFSIPQESVEGSYAVLYRFLGFLYNWRIFGETSIYTQPVVASFSREKFYNIIADVSDNYQQLSTRNLGFVKLYIYKISVGNEMHIIQRIAHDIKNQVHLVNMRLIESNQEEDDELVGAMQEIYEKSTMLSDFSRINLMQKTEVDLVTLLDNAIMKFYGHPRYNDIVWEYSEDKVLVNADENLLHVAVLNLLDNSLRYSPIGSKVIVTLIKDKYRIILAISNQSKDKVTDIRKGSGIGLMATNKIICAHEAIFNFSIEDEVKAEIIFNLRGMEDEDE